MRLRRETGDFQITVNTTAGTVNSIRSGLTAEDLAGELIKVDGVYEPVLSAGDSDGTTTLETKSYTLTYTKATGDISAEANESGGGESGGGSTGRMFEGVITSSDPWDGAFENPVPSFVDTPVPAGLTTSDFENSVFVFSVDNDVSGLDGDTYIFSVVGVSTMENHWSSKCQGFIRIWFEYSMANSIDISNWMLMYDPETGNMFIDPSQVPEDQVPEEDLSAD